MYCHMPSMSSKYALPTFLKLSHKKNNTVAHQIHTLPNKQSPPDMNTKEQARTVYAHISNQTQTKITPLQKDPKQRIPNIFTILYTIVYTIIIFYTILYAMLYTVLYYA